MANFESQLARMKSLYNYNRVDESAKKPEITMEYHAVGADGKAYAIIRENSKYFIKTAPKDKEYMAEAYDYIGGWMNHTANQFDSYNSAKQQFNIKMYNLNESFHPELNTEHVEVFGREDIIIEGTEEFRKEIARQRQIMHNVSVILNEASEININNTPNPKDPGKPKGVDSEDCPVCATKTESPYSETAKATLDKDLKDTCKDPKKANKEYTNAKCDLKEEDDKTFAAGLPGSAGVGEPDTDHNNNPYEETVNEEADERLTDKGLEKGPNDAVNANGQEPYGEGESINEEEDFDLDNLPPAPAEDGKQGVLEGEDDEVIDLGDDEDAEDDVDDVDLDDIDFDDEDAEGDEDFDAETDDDLDLGDEDGDEVDVEVEPEDNKYSELEAKIAELEAKIAELSGDESGAEDEIDVDAEDDLEGDEDFDAEDDFDVDGDVDLDGEEGLEGDNDLDFEEEPEDELDECGDMNAQLPDSLMESVVNSVIADFKAGRLNEDDLHVWGKHPGYQKKPMDLPETGSDENEHGRDWNDDSVYSEEPFGTKIGSSAPYDNLVAQITDSVMKQLKKKN